MNLSLNSRCMPIHLNTSLQDIIKLLKYGEHEIIITNNKTNKFILEFKVDKYFTFNNKHIDAKGDISDSVFLQRFLRY